MQQPVYLLFIDLAKAYDTVDREILWDTLLGELGIPVKLVSQLQQLYRHLEIELAGSPQVGHTRVLQGLKQGCPCSPLLFSIFFDRVERIVIEAFQEGASDQRHLLHFLTLVLVILLFADDVVLIAPSLHILGTVFRAFSDFCTTQCLSINQQKSKLLVVGDHSVPPAWHLDTWTFDRVDSFTYLGVELDQTGSPGHIISALATRATRAFGGLCDFVGAHRWSTPWTRLLLLDVYVRTLLTYGAAVWTPGLLGPMGDSPPTSPIGPLATIYRQCIRTLLRIPRDTRMEVIYILTLRWPLEVALGKATWRYFQRVQQLMGAGEETPVAIVATWAVRQDTDSYTLQQGLQWSRAYRSASALYDEARGLLYSGIQESTRLSHPALQFIWAGLIELSRVAHRPGAQHPVQLPGGFSASAARQLLGPAHCRVMGDFCCVLERPSWLLSSGHTFLSMIEYLYTDHSWVDDSSILTVQGCITDGFYFSFTPQSSWEPRHWLMHDIILSDSLSIALWIDCTLVWEMIDIARVGVQSVQ